MKMPNILKDLLDRPMWSLFLHLLPFLLVGLLPLLQPIDQPIGELPIGNILLFVMIYAIMALGLNIVLGYTGLLDLGFVTFLATGAVVTCLLLGATPLDNPGQFSHSLFASDGGYILILLISGAVCAILGILRGIPTLRLTGDYYAIVTLGLAEIVWLVYKNESNWTGGAFSVKLDFALRPSLGGEKLYWDTVPFFYLVYATLLLTLYVVYRLHNSRVGRAWEAIRVDDTAARCCGVRVGRFKMTAFAISGFFGGVGGSLYTIWIGTVAVNNLDIWQSILILCAVVLGGTGSLRGVLFGSLLMFSLREVMRQEIGGMRIPPEASFLVYGLLLVFIMRFRPEGLLPRVPGEREPTDEEERAMRSATTPLYILKEDPTPPTASENDPVVLQLDQLSRHFGGVKAVQDVSLEARKGQITSLIGPNGAGKTTVFNAITGIFPPTSGKVLFTPRPETPTRDISRLRTSEICEAGIARTFQNIRLFTDLPVLENVKVGLHSRTHSGVFGSIFTLPNTIREEDNINKAAIHYLDFVGLFHKANETADNLSYGDQRRVEIARALATHPRLLLLDEPAAGMNPNETAKLMELIYKIREAGVSVFLIEHDMKLVMQISDHVVCVDHGVRIAGGAPSSVREDPKVIEAYLGVQEEESS